MNLLIIFLLYFFYLLKWSAKRYGLGAKLLMHPNNE